jgi:hypothetical protein
MERRSFLKHGLELGAAAASIGPKAARDTEAAPAATEGWRAALRLHVRSLSPRYKPEHRSGEINVRRRGPAVAVALNH